jgi:hypothetical protein
VHQYAEENNITVFDIDEMMAPVSLDEFLKGHSAAYYVRRE